MKNLLLCFFLVFCAFHPALCDDEEIDFDAINATITCYREVNLTGEEIMRYNGQYFREAAPKLLCYIKCLIGKLHYLNSDNTISIEAMRKDSFPDGSNYTRDTFYQCVAKIPKPYVVNSCEDVRPLHKCIIQYQKPITVHEAMRKCSRENGLSEEDISNKRPGDSLNSAEKLYTLCFFRYRGHIGVDGEIFVDKLKEDRAVDGDHQHREKVYKCLTDMKFVRENVQEFIQCFMLEKLEHF